MFQTCFFSPERLLRIFHRFIFPRAASDSARLRDGCQTARLGLLPYKYICSTRKSTLFFLLSPCRNAFFEREKDCVEPVTIQLWK